MDQRIKIALERVQELNPHILMAVQHYNEKLICTAFLSEVVEGKTIVVHEKEYPEELIKDHEEEAIMSFLSETSFVIISQLNKE